MNGDENDASSADVPKKSTTEEADSSDFN